MNNEISSAWFACCMNPTLFIQDRAILLLKKHELSRIKTLYKSISKNNITVNSIQTN